MPRVTREGASDLNMSEHEPGTPWETEEWEAFKVRAVENGARVADWGMVDYVYWTEDGRFHRVDGPAIIKKYGREEWYQNGVHHRVGGPAVIWVKGGRKAWFLNGVRHRLDGPAVVYDDGREQWWKNGVRYTDGSFTVEYHGV